MKTNAEPIWTIWEQGGPFIGDNKPNAIVTVEWDWNLNAETTGAGNFPVNKLPIRWYEACAGVDPDDVMVVPNIKSISIDRSIDADADTCTVTIYNQKMRPNLDPQNDLSELGQPGYFTPAYGLGSEEAARWANHVTNDWVFALTPNTLIRTYQGYAPDGKSLADCLTDGNLVKSGTWLCDRVKVGTDGMLSLECRSMAKLLLDQQLYPPLVPKSVYPLHYARFVDKLEDKTRTVTKAMAGPRNLTYDTTANLAWYSGGVVHGHNPADAFDGNNDTFWLSVGNSGPHKPYATEWVQGNVGEWIDEVTINPWAGNYQCYISIMEGGVWQDESAGAVIPYEPLSVGRYRPAYEPSIHYVTQFGVPWESPVTMKLPRAYNAQKIRFTFTNLAKSPWGTYPYRAGLRSASVSMTGDVQTQESYQEWVRYDGNYKDYVDIVKDLLLWSGFWCHETLTNGESPAVRGRIESTGIYAVNDLADDLFDKRPVIDPITELKQVVGYIFYVDEDGAANFQSPNWWSVGNFDENGIPTDYIPQIDERVMLTGYSIQWSDETLRSEIILASSDPQPKGGITVDDIVVTRYYPNTRLILRGMCKPAMWVNKYFTSKEEQETMAEMIAMHTYFRLRQGNVSAWANPAIQIDDQVRIYERMTGETYVHYVRGISTNQDLDSGEYTMTLTTHWLGNPQGDWVVT